MIQGGGYAAGPALGAALQQVKLSSSCCCRMHIIVIKIHLTLQHVQHCC